MLTDIRLENLRPKDKLYRVTNWDGLCATVLMSGTASLRYDYNINGRRETLTLGGYGINGISLAEAEEKLHTAKKLFKSNISPAVDERYGKNKLRGSETLIVYIGSYMKYVILADGTRMTKEVVIKRDILSVLGNKLTTEITTTMVCNLCDRITDREDNATMVQVHETISDIYRYTNDRGHCFSSPAQDTKTSSITTFTPRLRNLSPRGVGMFFNTLDTVAGMLTPKLALKAIFLIMVRKSEFTLMTRDEVDFKTNEWTIPAGHMRRGQIHVIYLPRWVNNLLIGLKVCAGGNPYLPVGRYNINKPLPSATLSGVITTTAKVTQPQGKALECSTVHGMRRTASTLLHGTGYPPNWIKKCLTHKQKGVGAIYNKTEYARPRTYMPQQWANMVGSWTAGTTMTLIPFSPGKCKEWLELEK